jgi:MATE family multidrug resistance protein
MSDINRNNPHPAGSFRELWRVALPLILSCGSLSLMYVVDRIFLTWYSTDALAAVLPAGLLHWTVGSVLLGTVQYTNTFVAQYEGAGRKDRVATSVWQGLYLAAGGGLCLIVVIPFASQIFAMVGHTPALQKLEADYFSILVSAMGPMAMAAALGCFYSGRGQTTVVMWVHFTSAGVNILLDYCLIFGNGPFPELGIRGAAIATVIAKSIELLMYSVLILRYRNRDGYKILKYRAFDRELFSRMIRYGLPTGFQWLADIAGFALFIFLVGKIGTTELAATTIAFNLNTMAFIPVIGIGIAVMTLVGKRVGEGRPELAVRTTWLGFGMAGSWMIVFAAVYIFAPNFILQPYAMKSDPEEFAPIRELVIPLLWFVATYSFFDAMLIVFSSAVRGAGDTRFSLIFIFVGAWSLMVLPTFIVSKYYGGNLWLSWSACTTYIVVVGIGFLARFQLGKWKTMRVIESSLTDEPDSEAAETLPDVEPDVLGAPVATD